MPVLRTLTDGPDHHFFGYYYYCPWSPDQRFIAGLSVTATHPTAIAQAGYQAQIGLLDCEDDYRWRCIGTTAAWNWHQGSMLQWLPNGTLLHNALRQDGTVYCQGRLPDGRLSQEWDRGIFDVDRAGTRALGLSFARLGAWREVNTYAGATDGDIGVQVPDDDGIWSIDLESGAVDLRLSLAAMVAIAPLAEMHDVPHWINHLHWNPSGTRFLVIHRWQPPGDVPLRTRCWCFDADGGRPCIMGEGYFSHWDWLDDERIVVWTEVAGRRAFWEIRDEPGRLEPARPGAGARRFDQGQMDADGHGTFSADRRWFITDSPLDRWGGPATQHHLGIYDCRSDDLHHLVSIPRNTDFSGSFRCDMHPRWRQDGRAVLVDTSRHGSRQMALMELGAFIDGQG